MRKAGIWLLALYVALYLLPLGVRPLSSPDEVRYGAISHEMIASGNWVSPHFNGVRYFEKPIMGYWLDSAAMSALGEYPFALRLPTALAVGFTALTIFLLTARFATRRSAALATALYLTTWLVLGVGTTAVFDTFLTLFLTMALAAYCLALAAPPGRTRLGYLTICGAACGAAFLTKGFVALAIPVLVAAPFLALERRWRDLLTTPWVPILSAAVLIAPWAVWIHAREPDFWRYFFWVEHVQRFLGADAQHSEPFWFFFAYAPVAGLPWIWMLPAALQGLGKKPLADRKFLVYLACWLVLPWLFFSASKGKLMTYVLPCFPPLSMLLAIGLEGYAQLATRRWWRIGAASVGLVLAAALVVLTAAQAGAFGSAPYGSAETAKLAFVLLCLLAAIGAAAAAATLERPAARLTALGVTGAAFLLVLDFGLPRTTLDDLAPRALLTDGALVVPGTIVISDAPTFGAVAWYTKRNDIYLLSPGELGYGFSYPESHARNLQNDGLARLLTGSLGRHEIYIVTRPDNEAQVVDALPRDAVRVESGGLVRWHIPRRAGNSHVERLLPSAGTR